MRIDVSGRRGIKLISMEQQFSETFVLQDLRLAISRSSQKEVAKRLRLTPQYINDVLHRRRPVSSEMAKKLGYRRVVVFERI